ncbi:hypothetical protein AB0886_34600 [Streptomyces sp. NPDC024062]|uniref:hypothetical protein n=1 Tax=Streptomyces sp. NPDC024062 TaxID=3156646 RepID=UPI0034556FEB
MGQDRRGSGVERSPRAHRTQVCSPPRWSPVADKQVSIAEIEFFTRATTSGT